MFLDGDKVRCINPGRAGVFKLGGIYKIKRVISGGLNIDVIDETGVAVRKACTRFEKIKPILPPPKNDFEWLDRIQQNFKD